jgi:DNA-binding MarR family transcriptional regulator/GNAT superfamily N-acetyltransferase
MAEGMVEQVRRFNRTVTRCIGVLNENYLASDRSLGQNRLLWEIGADGCDIRSLREGLKLDSGYVSRLLRALEAGGLVVVEPSETDRRMRVARLTARGRSELAALNHRSDAVAETILQPLNDHQRTKLVTAMAAVERLLTASTVEIRECDPRDDAARLCLQAYDDELAVRVRGGYNPALNPVADAAMKPPGGLLLVATLHGEPVGCGSLLFCPEGIGLVKRMWVAQSVRGLGLGRRILDELEGRARANRLRLIRLDTNQDLSEAIRLYVTSGYSEVAPFNDNPYANHWFEKPLR